MSASRLPIFDSAVDKVWVILVFRLPCLFVFFYGFLPSRVFHEIGFSPYASHFQSQSLRAAVL